MTVVADVFSDKLEKSLKNLRIARGDQSSWFGLELVVLSESPVLHALLKVEIAELDQGIDVVRVETEDLLVDRHRFGVEARAPELLGDLEEILDSLLL